MKNMLFALVVGSLALSACGQRDAQLACNPNTQDCGQQQGTSTVIHQDHTGAILAGGAGLAAGYALGHHRGVNQQAQQPYGYHPYGYNRPTIIHHYGSSYQPQRTVVVHHYNSSARTVHVYHH